ncbi:agmatine deiminase family protein [Helicobacter cappadocius]|uniref:Agmatine deiminase family protein n=1 Tax=Helicobacter cappadocius TaxID=3063998 RepID=A0AA90PUC5_9HELI|nr:MULTISPECIES: agmatine deiminase family protein [unclassified Helicobacter]MDO7253810.1 agmatine deiminase family protein [Helicobacter sp. faydin-H75]MDP2539699.1 agmatine deiminase family protein [Helicobacter sp. faydin-H76]
MKRLKAEWEKQRAVLLAFPHKNSDWAEYISEARENFLAIIKEITRFEKVILCVDVEDSEGMEILQKSNLSNIEFVNVPTNDTWARDFGPIAIEQNHSIELLNFGFNGWGLKFAANKDNQINQNLFDRGVFNTLKNMPIILEGGSIDTDGEGRLLTNTQCLLELNRNPHLSQGEIEEFLKRILGINEVLWLHSGYLAGDDTDSHIDTLARFVNPHTIAYMKCEDKNDEHYAELRKMEEELMVLRTREGKPYTLVPLPLPNAIFYDGERLPASYVNFLFINGAILVPTYRDKKDEEVLEIFRNSCPDLEVIGIDCSTLIRQHGSLHCVTMQIF